jgi:uridine kinase
LPQKSIVFGVAGGTASGKTTVARAILEAVGASQIAYLPHDAYYKDNPNLSLAERAQVNYDHPNSLESKLMVKHIHQLLQGKAVHVPVYDFTAHRRTTETVLVEPCPIILVDGILIFTKRKLRELMDIKIFHRYRCGCAVYSALDARHGRARPFASLRCGTISGNSTTDASEVR